MKKYILPIFILIVLVGIVFFLYIIKKDSNLTEQKKDDIKTLVKNDVPKNNLLLNDGSTIQLPEFITQNEKTTKLTPETFREIAGGNNLNFSISYLPYNKENSQIQFTVILNKLPLSKSRVEAENALRTKLGLSNEELCKLDLSVYVFGWINKDLAGQNLGLSFCDGAMDLP